jgi:hypothetical protein
MKIDVEVHCNGLRKQEIRKYYCISAEISKTNATIKDLIKAEIPISPLLNLHFCMHGKQIDLRICICRLLSVL